MLTQQRIDAGRLSLSLGVAVALLTAVPDTRAQWSYRQPWNHQRDAHESRVLSCATPQPHNQKAFDDFYVDPDDLEQNETSVTIGVVCWWGVLAQDPDQADPGEFVISFASHDPSSCQPAGAIAKHCVDPSVRRVGTDCAGQPVYRFRAMLPGGFTAAAGGHYWISIAEDDANSPTEDVDFFWSGHRRPKLCNALQFAAGGAVTQPLVSVCDGRTNDLAFCLIARGVGGSIVGLATTQAEASLEIHEIDPNSTLLETVPVDIYSDGVFQANPTAPDGNYLAVLRIPGALPMEAPIMLASGNETHLDIPFYIRFGELTGDGMIDLADLASLLSNYGLP